jgi:hypothetical protein
MLWFSRGRLRRDRAKHDTGESPPMRSTRVRQRRRGEVRMFHWIVGAIVLFGFAYLATLFALIGSG